MLKVMTWWQSVIVFVDCHLFRGRLPCVWKYVWTCTNDYCMQLKVYSYKFEYFLSRFKFKDIMLILSTRFTSVTMLVYNEWFPGLVLSSNWFSVNYLKLFINFKLFLLGKGPSCLKLMILGYLFNKHFPFLTLSIETSIAKLKGEQ
jgi:hypothetical protein